MDESRNEFRRRVNERFLNRRRTAVTEAYTYSYEQALQLMARKEVFDVSKEPARDHDRYGRYDLGRHCLLARRLLEKGATFVQVSHSNYDTHNENFNFHIEQLGEFDQSFAALVADLADRGMLDSTLIVVISEFGRTPNINHFYGRDHWSHAWSVVVAGGKIHRGMAYGKTNANGTEVVDGQVDHANLFHTYLQAVGVDSTDTFEIEGRDVPIADPSSRIIRPILGLMLTPGLRSQSEISSVTDTPRIDPKQAHLVAQWPAGRPIVCCRFDPTGRFLFCGLESSTIERFNVADGKKSPFKGGHDSWVFTLAFSPSGETIYSGGGDGRIVAWETTATSPKPTPDDRGPSTAGFAPLP